MNSNKRPEKLVNN